MNQQEISKKVRNEPRFAAFLENIEYLCAVKSTLLLMSNKKMMIMEEKELKAEDIPWGYPLCFNNECADKDKCMHYQD